MVKATGLQRPERGTIGKSASRRDYPMSTPSRLMQKIGALKTKGIFRAEDRLEIRRVRGDNDQR
jgi:hypothetical protein